MYAQVFIVLDPSGAKLANVSPANPPTGFSAGDRTGVHLVSVTDRLGEADLDGFTNDDELKVGTNPLDTLSAPVLSYYSGIPAPGSSFTVSATISTEASYGFICGASLGTAGLWLGQVDCRTIPLSFDAALLYWLSPANTLATTPITGVLDATGTGTVTVTIPPGPSLSGITLFFDVVTISPFTGGASTITWPVGVALM
jgi:hypothetical protein